MSGQEIELFLHGPGHRPQVISALVNEPLRLVLERNGRLPGEGQHVFVGETLMAIERPDSDEDDHQPVAILDITIAELDLPRLKHIHSGAPHRLKVEVLYNGERHSRRFSPATTVGTVLAWAKKRFKIDPAAGANLILELEPNKVHPAANQHLGELPRQDCDELKFKLVAEINPQG